MKGNRKSEILSVEETRRLHPIKELGERLRRLKESVKLSQVKMAELSGKVIRGLTDSALKCKYNGGTVPMGYYIDEQQYYQIDPKTAPVALEMFTKYSEGATMQELVHLLNSRGIRSIRGGKITLNIMNHLLKNRRYMGEYSYRGAVKEDGIPAIVSKELFERVQEQLTKNKKAPARHKAEDDYLLTTKLYCGKCDSFMVGESGTSHTMKVHRYYRCVNTKKKKLCDKKAPTCPF